MSDQPNSILPLATPFDGTEIGYIVQGGNSRRFTTSMLLQAKTPQMFGAVGDGVTDDYIALQAWLDAGGYLHLPAAHYICSQRLQVRKHVTVQGVGFGFNALLAGYALMPGSRISFPAGQGGIIVWTQTTHSDTSDVVGNPGLYFTQEGGYASSFKDLALIGVNSGAVATGFESRTRVFLDNVHVIQFKGKGFDLQGTSDIDDLSSDYGNVSLSSIRNSRAVENGSHGFNVRGRDSSVVMLDNCDASSNGGWGFLFNSFSGGVVSNCHAAGNASGSYKESSGIAATTFIGNYVEGGAGSNCDISYPCSVTGGTLASVVLDPVGNAHSGGPLPAIISGTFSNFNYLRFNFTWDPPGASIGYSVAYQHATHGLMMQGYGATFDLTIRNSLNEDVLQNPTATRDLVVGGDIDLATGKSVAVDGSPLLVAENNLIEVVDPIEARNNLDIQTELIVAMSDNSTALTVADDKEIIHAPYDFDLLDVMTGLSTVSSSGAVTIDIEVAGVSVFTTKPSIAVGDDHSTDASSTDAVLTSTPLAVTKGQKIALHQDAAGTGAKGMKAYLMIRRTS